FAIGKAETLRAGEDVAIVACGIMVSRAMAAAEALAEEGVSARVLDMPTIKPLDRDAVLCAAAETGAIVTAEEHSIIGGLGGAVCEAVCESCPAPVVRVGVRDQFGKSGKPDEVLAAYGLTVADIVSAGRRAVSMKNA
ncbi:MAG TPA: transketolase, partial [Firmicutes bacterium]|nr:transketolase [Bacillota bacterium]